MIGVIDYHMGNLRSVQKAFEMLGAKVTILRRPDEVTQVDKLVLPGVGAFTDGMDHLDRLGFTPAIGEFLGTGRPMLGICLGMQLLFEQSEEDAPNRGLGVFRGAVVQFRGEAYGAGKLKVPHMGWNQLSWSGGANPLLTGLEPGASVYFVHSFHAVPADEAVAATTTDYGITFCSSVWRDNIWATQFHPEKSQRVGLAMLANFMNL
jgi:glutamine amidotransferase